MTRISALCFLLVFIVKSVLILSVYLWNYCRIWLSLWHAHTLFYSLSYCQHCRLFAVIVFVLRDAAGLSVSVYVFVVHVCMVRMRASMHVFNSCKFASYIHAKWKKHMQDVELKPIRECLCTYMYGDRFTMSSLSPSSLLSNKKFRLVI